MINNVNNYGANGPNNKVGESPQKSQNLDLQAQNQRPAPMDQAAGQKGDRVELSQSAKMMKNLEDDIKKMPEVDKEKVEKIKNAIRNGEYQIDHERLAAAISKIESEI